MASFRLKRKTFGMFALTAKNFKNMKNAFSTGNMGGAMKFAGKTAAHATAGLAKGAAVAGGIGLVGTGLGASALDNIGNN